MIKKILVNSPKGGVGKTTLAINIALYLNKKGYKVKAYDIAQGQQMSKALINNNFNKSDIDVKELGEIPKTFKGIRNYDFLVIDTDDYYKILTELKNDYYVIVPILYGKNELERIPEEISAVLTTAMLSDHNLKLNIVHNKFENQNSYNIIKNRLNEEGIDHKLLSTVIKKSEFFDPLITTDKNLNQDIEKLLQEIGVI